MQQKKVAATLRTACGRGGGGREWGKLFIHNKSSAQNFERGFDRGALLIGIRRLSGGSFGAF